MLIFVQSIAVRERGISNS